MRSEARLDSAVFQLTPTRTRCDLVIIANGKTEKLASGLLNPFLAHLKTAQDQVAKGGYSIILEPDPEIDTSWFTKGTVERFVRFVSTPEVLERVSTIESEILQIENAIAIQGNDNFDLNTVADHQTMQAVSAEGIKTSVDTEAEKAIVLYKPATQSNPPDSNGTTTQENSKVQLLRVLETRKMVLRKEQGMAFARATAAGFDIDKMVDLVSFAESFGASRLKEACIRFIELWKKKHETGQWLEVEAAEAMSTRSEFSALNASSIVFAADSMVPKDYGDARSIPGGDIVTENDGKADKQIASDAKSPLGHQEHYQGQFQHPTYQQWPMPPPPGHPAFLPYSIQGMPYYKNYPGSIPYFHSPYSPIEDPRANRSGRKGSKRQSTDNKEIESENGERSTRSQDDTDQNSSDLENEGSHGHKCQKSGKKKSGVVIIRNLNYISKKNGARESEDGSQSVSESEDEINDLQSDMQESKHKHSGRISKKGVRRTKSVEYSDAYTNDRAADGEEADSGNWQAFQTFLLRAEERSRRTDDMFAGEKEPPSKRKHNKGEVDPIVPHDRDYGDFHDQRIGGFHSVNGKASRMRQAASDDPSLLSSKGTTIPIDNQFKEVQGGGGAYRRMSSDEFMIYGRDKQLNNKRSSDPFVGHADGTAVKNSSSNITDDSFMLPYRSGSQYIGSDSINAIDMDSAFPLSLQKAQNSYVNAKNQNSYEPDDLSLVPKRGMESVSVGYDPAVEYNLMNPVGNSVKLDASNPEDVPKNTKEEPKKLDKGKNLKASKDSMEKRRKDALLKRGSSSRSNPLTEAQKRAEKLRSYKADLQKVKKEREEEEMKRLEALKRERQRRIAARSSSTTTQLPLTPQQIKTRLATKPLPSPYKSSKFSDAEPVSSSPLRKLPIRTSSTGSNEFKKATKSSRLNGGDHGLTRSASSLPVAKRETNGLMTEAKADSLRMRRLSDPKNSFSQRTSLIKSVAANQLHKKSIPDESQKKITAIMQLDKSKIATLPELRIRTPRTSNARVEKESASKDHLKKGTGNKTSQACGSVNGKLSNDKPPSNSDENLVIDKTVVMLEANVVTAPVREATKILDIRERSQEDGLGTGYTTIHAPPSPFIKVEGSGVDKSDEQMNSCEVIVPLRNEPQNFSNSAVTKNPYQAPYARATSLEDPVTTNLGHDGQAASKSGMVPIRAQNIATHVANFEKLSLGDQTCDTIEKPRNKEAKGFRKLLKFGRKSHSSVTGEGSIDSEVSSTDDQTVPAGSSNDVHLLKNLISQDDTHTGGTPTKVSRPFSLLSPFRSKCSEKKQAA
ncbi:hypothetical protein Cni_G24716 [Canna indica]|uniref:COP1-interacting protein 7 n=1 Tax=Canna indica TaxID=4628 RepID=A0AAQ3KWD8_9LILI|nr:hypothetical protein Cni_G24716 [Canna indica]